MTNTRPNTDIHLTWYNCKWNRLIHKGFYLVINSVFCGWGTGLILKPPSAVWSHCNLISVQEAAPQSSYCTVPWQTARVSFLDTHPFKRLIKYWGLMTPCWHWGFQATMAKLKDIKYVHKYPWRHPLSSPPPPWMLNRRRFRADNFSGDMHDSKTQMST